MIHASTCFFPSNLGTSESFILSEGSLAGWAYGAGLCAEGALLLAGVAGAWIEGVAAEVAAELASSWSHASRFPSLCSIL